jgi:hypothetical protein
MDILLNFVMLVVAALAGLGSIRQSRIARSLGNNAAANLWIVAGIFCGIIAIMELVGLVTLIANS